MESSFNYLTTQQPSPHTNLPDLHLRNSIARVVANFARSIARAESCSALGRTFSVEVEIFKWWLFYDGWTNNHTTFTTDVATASIRSALRIHQTNQLCGLKVTVVQQKCIAIVLCDKASWMDVEQ